MQAAPAPFHILRNHSSPLSALSINPSNTLLYTGDQDGNVGMTDLSSRRIVRLWKAHNESILSVEEWNGHLISHGRDNMIKMYEPLRLSGRLGQGIDKSKGLGVVRELDVNALNFCRFSIASSSSGGEKGKGKEAEGILVVPSLLDSEYADIYHLPSFKRLHSSFSYVPTIKTPGASFSRTGLIMSIHSCLTTRPDGSEGIRTAIGYEDGRVEVWALQDGVSWRDPSNARMGPSPWEKVYEGKKHNEAIMAMVTNTDLTRAWTVSADHQLISYDLLSDSSTKAWSTGHIGHASLAVSPHGNVLAVGGWDGHIRLFSSATGKPLGDLEYHRESIHVLAFAHKSVLDSTGTEVESTIELGNEEDSDEDENGSGGVHRERWLVSGSKDRRVALWELIDFTKSTHV